MIQSRLLSAYSPSLDTNCVALVKSVKVVIVVSKKASQLGLHIADTKAREALLLIRGRTASRTGRPISGWNMFPYTTLHDRAAGDSRRVADSGADDRMIAYIHVCSSQG